MEYTNFSSADNESYEEQKEQRRLVAAGKINEHPWEKYLEAKADFSDDEAAEEAAKWAQEQKEKAQEEESKKKDSDMDRTERGSTNQEDQRDVGYIQNAEQNTSTLWNRVKAAKGE